MPEKVYFENNLMFKFPVESAITDFSGICRIKISLCAYSMGRYLESSHG